MTLKDILTITTSPKASQPVLDMAAQLSERFSARVSTLLVQWMPALPIATDAWVADPWWADMVRDARASLEADGVEMKAALEKQTGKADVTPILIDAGSSRSLLGMRARHTDLTVLARPEKPGDTAGELLTGPLFDSGRPVLLVPPNAGRRPIGQSVLVCWKPTREAARAVGDADHFLTSARQVSVVTVDAQPSEFGYGAHPGADITAHLARRGCRVELFNLDSTGRSEARAILDQADAVGADMIVMGGFGRSRMSEFIFGGVTRDMLKLADLPILMSH